MIISQVKELLKLYLQGDNANFSLTGLILGECIKDVLRATRPRTHIVRIEKKEFDFTQFRKISNSHYLRMPYVDLDDNAGLDMQEELNMAVVFFLCSAFSKDRAQYFKDRANEIIAIYDTNLAYKREFDYVNIYLQNPKKEGEKLTPILKKISLEVGETKIFKIDATQEYKVQVKGDFLKYELKNGELIISASKEGEGEISLISQIEILNFKVVALISDGAVID